MNAAEVLTPLPRVVRDEPGGDDLYEIIDGVRVEMSPMSSRSTAVAVDIARLLSNYGLANNLGKAYTEMLLRLPLSRDRNRRPDVAFVPFTRWPRGKPEPDTNAWDVLPDLFVEVVSPRDEAEEIETKVGEYFEAGARLVWVVYPRHRAVYVYESAQLVRRLGRADALAADPVLPGFRLPLAELFPEPPPESPPA